MPLEVTIAYNNPNPEEGGIPRYGYRILEGVKERPDLDIKEIDFTPVYGDTTLQKLYNTLHGRKKHLQDNSDNLSQVNHFLQPEIYWNNDNETKDIVTIHDLNMVDKKDKADTFYEKGRRFLMEKRFNHSLKHADHFIAVSEQTMQELVNHGVSSSKISVVNHGVRGKFSKNNSWPKRDKKIGYLGSLNSRKRVGKLLQDWTNSNTKNYDLEIGGWGGLHAENLKQEYGDKQNVTFHGRVPEQDIVEFYNDVQALFIPSEREGFGLPIVEALACGTPVFIYNDADITPEVRQFCTSVGSVEEMFDFLNHYRESDAVEISETVRKRFDWGKAVERTEEVYKRVAS